VHGDTSTTMAQPLDGIGAIAQEVGALVYVDATATIGGMEIASDRWGADVVTGGLQKCLGGPSGSSPITISEAAAAHILHRRHVEKGIARDDIADGIGAMIGSNYFDLAMVMDYWGPSVSTTIPRRPPCSMARANVPAWCWRKVCQRALPAMPPPGVP
jgi:(S)-ureidoglycine-glyoxylate aminotransferase